MPGILSKGGFGGKLRTYQIHLGECTKELYDITHAKSPALDPKTGKSKYRIVKCAKCGLLDAVPRVKAGGKAVLERGRCPRCGGRRELLFR